MAARDFYEVLGVARDADQEEIQRAYRTLVRRYHPDVNSDAGADERFREIAEAYRVLSDPQLRARYDRARSIRVNTGRFGGGPGFPRGHYLGGDFLGGDPGRLADVGVDDLLSGFFGGSGYARPRRGADREAEIELTVEEAHAGGRHRFRVETPVGPRRYEVPIPAGVTHGQRLRFAGQGAPGTGGAPPGDLTLVVRLAPHPRYRVAGRDLTVEVRVAPWEAALGASVPVPTPGGTVRVELPAGSSSGHTLRLRGRGLSNPGGTPGDLYAEIRIVVPARLTAAERRLFARLAEESRFDPRGTGD